MTTIDDRPVAAHLLGWDCVELWVGNARTTAGFLMSAFGFRCTAYAGPETGVRTKASYVLEQGDIRFVVSGALSADSPIAEHVRRHGDGVHDLAWLVDDARAAFAAAVSRGAKPAREPWVESDDQGELELAQVAAYGDTVHTFVNRSRYRGEVLEPGYTAENLPNPTVGPPVGLTRIDHVVGNVEKGRLDDWVRFYAEVMGFAQLQHFDDDQIRTEYSALMSTVVWDGSKIVMPINEPADGLRKSQIQEYIEHYDGPGVQHLALRTEDIVATVQALRDRGVRFMSVPDTYYDEAKERLAAFDLPWDELARLNILADQDHEGYLLQIFTETITDRPAVFFEIIERRGAKGFGEGNFKALFEAIERDQATRQPVSTWAPVPEGSGFGLANLPLGVVRPPAREPRVAVRVGQHTLDLAAAEILPSLTMQPSLDALLARGVRTCDEVRERARDVLLGPERGDWLWPLDAVDALLPFTVRDYVDFYSSLHHAENLGRILRPGTDPLPANWRHLPAGYHGRSGTVQVSGRPVARPWGLVPGADGRPRLQPTAMLDIELEVGFVVAGPPATRIGPDDAYHHVFGVVLLDDWSARDIQAFEYQPLGPHLGKSFATTISAWVVSLDALRPHLVAPPPQDPEPDPYLRSARPWGLDLSLGVELNGTEVACPSFAGMYWTFAQQLAHLTVNGATTGGGDLFGSGTVSGPEHHERGSLIELTWRGAEPLTLADGSTRSFLEDGDTVVLRGSAGGTAGAPRIELGECRGTIVASQPPGGGGEG